MVEPAVLVPFHPAHGGGAADLVERAHAVDGRSRVPCRIAIHGPNRRGSGRVEQVADELPVPPPRRCAAAAACRGRAPRPSGNNGSISPISRHYVTVPAFRNVRDDSSREYGRWPAAGRRPGPGRAGTSRRSAPRAGRPAIKRGQFGQAWLALAPTALCRRPLDAVLGHRFEIGDGINPGRLDTELEGQLHVVRGRTCR